MRRSGGLWGSVATFSALIAAAHRAAHGKRNARSVARFLERLEPEALALERELGDGSWRPGPVATFPIEDPKPRTITALPFRDQVVHHAIIGALEPVFERRMLGDSYACRTGKGAHRALDRAQAFVRRFGWFLKLDVRSFFDSVDHPLIRFTPILLALPLVLDLATEAVPPCPCRRPARRLPGNAPTSRTRPMRSPSRFLLALTALALAACGNDHGGSGGYGTSSGSAGAPAGATRAPASDSGSGESCGGGGSSRRDGTAAAAPAAAVPAAAVRVVEIRNMAFVPATVTVKVGEAVRWVNRDSTPHTATRDSGDPRFDTGTLSKDEESQPVTFSTASGAAGYAYVCSFHGSMRGSVVVTR